MPLKPALLDWAAREQYPVHYAAITCRTMPDAPPAQQAICWWGAKPFGSHLLGVLRMKRFDAIVDCAPQQGVALLELLSDQEYAENPGGPSPVGAQYRHVLEHY